MSESQATAETRTPIHLWIVGVLTLLWNGMGAFDYLMTQTENEAYMSRFTPEQLEFFYGFPSGSYSSGPWPCGEACWEAFSF